MLGPTAKWLQGVPPGKVEHFAGQARLLDAAELGKVGVVKRTALLACLLHMRRCDRYALTVFAYGTNAGPAQVARHIRQKASVHELSIEGNQHITSPS